MHQGGTDTTDFEPVASAACEKFGVLSAKEQPVSVQEPHFLEHFAPNGKADPMKPTLAQRMLHLLNKVLGEGVEVIVELKFHNCRADDIQSVPLSGGNLGFDKIVATDNIVIQQNNPIAGR